MDEKKEKVNQDDVIEKRIKPTVILRRSKKVSAQKEQELKVKEERPPQKEESLEAKVVEKEKSEIKKKEIVEEKEALVDKKAAVTVEKEEKVVELKKVEEEPQPTTEAKESAQISLQEEEIKKEEKKPKEQKRKKVQKPKAKKVKEKIKPARIVGRIELPQDKTKEVKETKEIKKIEKEEPHVVETKPKEEKKRPKPHLIGEREELKKRPISKKRLVYKRKEMVTPKEFDIEETTHEDKVLVRIPSRRKEVYKQPQKTKITTPKPIKRIIKISEQISVAELSKKMGVKASEVIKKLIDLGVMATINQNLDIDTASLVAADFGFDIEKVQLEAEKILQEIEDKPEDLVTRPPVVTVMGHVDHGKTLLLDAIRNTRVVEKEKGGITQHIGAYNVKIDGKSITFIDTPGHEAFTAMRSRGAHVTDIVVLVVAADDGVMEQTKEAINHAKAANVPIVVAINKIDKPNANVERVRQALAEYGIIPEEWGGDNLFVETSAKLKKGIKELLEAILLQAELMELKANPKKDARGVILESRLDKGKGPVGTVLIKEGTLKLGVPFVAGSAYGRVRTMIDDKGKRLKEAGPSIPVEVSGFSQLPKAGDIFITSEDEKSVKTLAQIRKEKDWEKTVAKPAYPASKDDLLFSEDKKELNIILKSDAQGTLEALLSSLEDLSTDEVKVTVIHAGVGEITESDLHLAVASQARIIGFNVKIPANILSLAQQEKINIKLYNVIYEAIEDIEKVTKGLLAPHVEEKIIGRCEIRAVFQIPKLGKVAGVFVQDGKIVRNGMVRLYRDGSLLYDGKISSLKRFKEDVKEVLAGYECGVGLENFQDIQEEDILECYTISESPANNL
ncbi:MAG: translation initiation factor IF-2 [Deltaproteobacteria bacterium]|nr:translation initiation factor IF-2 [Deltaproteobacteria bacterium]